MFAPSEAVALDPAARQKDLRQWFASLLAASLYSEHEDDLAKLVPLRLPPSPA